MTIFLRASMMIASVVLGTYTTTAAQAKLAKIYDIRHGPDAPRLPLDWVYIHEMFEKRGLDTIPINII